MLSLRTVILGEVVGPFEPGKDASFAGVMAGRQPIENQRRAFDSGITRLRIGHFFAGRIAQLVRARR